jgi:ABC-type sugar transport system ATPase subunit
MAEETMSNRLELRSIDKEYGAVAVLNGVDLAIDPGEILGLTGPSAAGKTTICRIITGIERPTRGGVWLGDREWTGVTPQRRNAAYMFESYALYPQFTVYENIAFPLAAPNKAGRYSERAIASRVAEVIELVELQGLEHRLPGELSGGQKQRVALCRTLAQEPSVFLLDEPIAHLDATLRHKLRGEIRRRQIHTDSPTLWCTPDAMEAISVADRVVVLIDGVVQQEGTPEEIYLRPANVEVARLMGDPAINLLPGRLTHENGKLVFAHEMVKVALPGALRVRLEGRTNGADLLLGIRPTNFRVSKPEGGDGSAVASVYTFEPFGKYSVITARLGKDTVKVKTYDRTRFKAEDAINLEILEGDFVVFDATTGAAI